MQNTTCMRENKKFPRRVRRGILHNTSLSPKTTNFPHNCRANTRWDPLFRSLVSCSAPQPWGKFQGVNFWTGPLLTALAAKYFGHSRGFLFSFASSASSCFQDSFLFPFLKLTLLNMPDLARAPKSYSLFFSKLRATAAFYFKCWTNKSHLTWVFCEPECVRCWKASARISKTILRQN